jgi:Flp pilus assembly protein TadG
MRRWRLRERGSVSVEMAMLAPVFALLLFASIWFGRIAVATNAIDVAAHDAARAASISRTASSAATNAEAAANQALDQQGLDCVGGPNVQPDTSGFGQTDVDLEFVTVTIVCDVSFNDIAFPGVPRTWTVESTFISPIDVFREQP